MSYEDITDSKACIDELERLFGTSHAEQAAHLFEDNDDLEQYNVTALSEIEEFLTDSFEEDPDAEYIRNRAVTVLDLIKLQEQDEYLTEATKTIRLEMKLDAMIALAIGSEREELLPSEERINRHLEPDEDTTPNEAALMANLGEWIKVAVEASRALIAAKRREASLRVRAEDAEERFAVVQRDLQAISRHARRAEHTILKQQQFPEDS